MKMKFAVIYTLKECLKRARLTKLKNFASNKF